MKRKTIDLNTFLFIFVIIAIVLLGTVGTQLYTKNHSKESVLYEDNSPEQTVYKYYQQKAKSNNIKELNINKIEEVDKELFMLRRYGGKALLIEENITEEDISIVVASYNITYQTLKSDVDFKQKFILTKNKESKWTIYKDVSRFDNTLDSEYEVAEDSCNELLIKPEVIDLKVNKITQVNKDLHKNDVNHVQLWSKYNIEPDGVKILAVDYSIDYNKNKTKLQTGHYTQLKYLIRKDEISDWQIIYEDVPEQYQLVSAEETVKQYLDTMKKDPNNWVKSFKLDKVLKADDEEIKDYENRWKDTPKWKLYEVEKGNVTIIDSYYDVEYDNTKSFKESGYIKHRMYLVRRNENSPWIIWDHMSPYEVKKQE